MCSDRQNEINVSMGGVASNYNDLAMLLPSVRVSDSLRNAEDGFLRWDPSSQNSGHSDLGLVASDTASEINAAREHGCGYEAQLESWYRFLVDPEPVTTLDHTDDTATAIRGDTNIIVLAQRQAFLRPDSVLAIVMLTDENDCSVVDEDGAQGWLVSYKGGTEPNAQLWHMPRATSICESNPSDPHCRPCDPNEDYNDPSFQKGVTLGLNEDSM
ncbi:MAG TPA: hypothetical protein VNN72_18035, partial [Polyangiaceae bacterium]|nr:hypothetical protein [Polyangiaceae bacterium]